MHPIHLFYSWQSDRDSKICSNFIRIALEAAILQLKAEHQIEIELDSDTAGVAGTPPVSETILRKIADCDIFVGDVTFVGQTDRGKLLPNPNVMTEFGFARAKLDDQQILLVMNTEFGPERDLPFDLAHLRYPTAYSLDESASDGDRRKIRSSFAEKLAPKLLAMATRVLSLRDKTKPSADAIAPARDLINTVLQLNGRNEVPAIIPGPKLVVQLAPAAALNEPNLAPARINAIWSMFVPTGYQQSTNQVNASEWASFDPPRPVQGKPNPEARWYTRLTRPGVFDASITIGAKIGDDSTILVELESLGARLVEIAVRLGKIVAALGLDGPLLLSAAVLGLDDVQMMSGHRASRPLRIPGLSLGEVTFSSASAITVSALRSTLDRLWLGSGFAEGLTFSEHISESDLLRILPPPIVATDRGWQ